MEGVEGVEEVEEVEEVEGVEGVEGVKGDLLSVGIGYRSNRYITTMVLGGPMI